MTIKNRRSFNHICFYDFNSNKLVTQFISLHVNRCPILAAVLLIWVLTTSNFDYSYGQVGNKNITDINVVNIVINPVTNKSYFITPDEGKVSDEGKVYVVNDTTNSIIKPIPLTDLDDTGRAELNPVTGLLYIGADEKLYVIDGINDEINDTISRNWIDFKVNPLNNKLYFLEEVFPNTVLKELDLSTKNVLRDMIFRSDDPTLMDIIPSKELIYIADYYEGQVKIINASSSLKDFKLVDSVRVANDTRELISSPLNNKTYLINELANRISIINSDNNNTIETIFLDSPENPKGDDNIVTDPNFAIDPTNYLIYILGSEQEEVTVVNETSKKLLTSFNLEGSPTNLIHSVIGDKLYVTSLHDPVRLFNVSKESIDIKRLNFTRDDPPGISLKYAPSSMVINPENERLYISYPDIKEISIIDTSTDKLLEPIYLDFVPTNIALNPQTDSLYVTSNDTLHILNTSNNQLFKNILSLNLTIDNLAIDSSNNSVYLHTPDTPDTKLGFLDPGLTLVYQLENNLFHQVTNFTGSIILNSSPLIYTSIDISEDLWSQDSFYILLPDSTYKFTIPEFDPNYPFVDIDYDPKKSLAYILKDSSLYLVDYVTATTKNITQFDSMFASGMLVDSDKNTIYVSDSVRNLVQVINVLTGEIIGEIHVGNSPKDMVLNPKNGIVYVLNEESNLISVINSSSYKPLVPSMIFNLNPANAGYIKCNTNDIASNQYIRINYGEKCEAIANQGFEFSNWVENFGNNSTKIVSSVSKENYWYTPFENFVKYVKNNLGIETSKNDAAVFTILRNGNFTSNFERVPPPLPPEYWTTLTSFVLTTIFGAIFIPAFIGYVRTRSKLSKLNKFHQQIASIYDDYKLDGKDMTILDDLKPKITNSYSEGKISVEQYDNLNMEISIAYDEIFNDRIDSIKNDKEFIQKLKPIEEEITKAYSRKKLLELQYKLLKEKIKELRGDNKIDFD